MARDKFEFMKAAIRRPLEVSTIFPTSRPLAETLLDLSDLFDAQTVVELGPGTGAITRHLAQRLGQRFASRPDLGNGYFGIEIDEPMVMYLRESFPALRFEVGLAESLPMLVEPGSIDRVVSSLPWTVFSDETQTRTIDAITHALKPGGIFTTYICANALWYPQARAFVRKLKARFSSVIRSDLEWRNIPPAYVYRSVK